MLCDEISEMEARVQAILAQKQEAAAQAEAERRFRAQQYEERVNRDARVVARFHASEEPVTQAQRNQYYDQAEDRYDGP